MTKKDTKFLDLNNKKSYLSDEQFLKTLVHESNNFLSPISGYTEILLMEDSINNKQRSYLKEVTTAVKRHAEFNFQLLMLTGRLETKIEEVSSDELIELINLAKFKLISKLKNVVQFKTNKSWMLKILEELMTFANSLEQTSTEVHLSQCDDYLRVSSRFLTEPGVVDKNQFFRPFYTSRVLSLGKGLGLCWLPPLMKNIGGEIQLEINLLGEIELALFFPITS
jgi:signal transduction histidine kinase